MLYISSFLILISLFFIESSLLPHLVPHIFIPLLVLPFLSIIAMKDRTLFPIFLASIAGLLTDAISGNIIPVYSISYILVVFISKVFFARFISYGEARANVINTLTGMAFIYGAELIINFNNIDRIDWLLPFVFGIILTFVALFLFMYLGHKYFLWIEKETEERYR